MNKLLLLGILIGYLFDATVFAYIEVDKNFANERELYLNGRRNVARKSKINRDNRVYSYVATKEHFKNDTEACNNLKKEIRNACAETQYNKLHRDLEENNTDVQEVENIEEDDTDEVCFIYFSCNKNIIHSRIIHELIGNDGIIERDNIIYMFQDEQQNDEVIEEKENLTSITAAGKSRQGKSWGINRINQENLPLDNDSSSYHGYTGKGVHVYIIDTGINENHQEYKTRVGNGISFVKSEKSVNDKNGHGSHCAGTAVGKQVGVATGATLHGVKVLDSKGSGKNSIVIKGINWAVKEAKERGQPAVISLSLGGGTNKALNRAAKAAANKNIIVVAAGNSNDDACRYSPAGVGGKAYAGNNVITVGSTTKDDKRSSFSNYGKCLDMYAPGSDIYSAWSGNPSSYKKISGTSMAAPHVAGIAALHLEKFKFNKNRAQLNMFIDAVKSKISNAGAKTKNNYFAQIPSDYIGPDKKLIPPLPPPPPFKLCRTGKNSCYRFEKSLFGQKLKDAITVENNGIINLVDLKSTGCKPAAFSGMDIQNKWVVIDRGNCDFYDKVKYSQQKNARGVIIVQNTSDGPFQAISNKKKDDIKIASIMVSRRDGNAIRKYLNLQFKR